MNGTARSGGRILLLDDDPSGVGLLQRMLRRAGYADITSFTEAEPALQAMAEAPPDLLLLDMNMPVPGLEVMRLMAAAHLEVATVCLTGDDDRSLRRRALELGALDFLTKPFDAEEVVLRVRNLLRMRLLQDELLHTNSLLEARVRERTQELERSRDEVLVRLSKAAEYRDDDTHEHTQRVGTASALVAGSLGQDQEWVDMLRRVAPLHDLGKIGVPDAVLLKKGRLTAAEFAIVKRHTDIGQLILSGGQSAMILLAEEVALTHHEKWNGEGYLGMAGTGIPLSGRIVAVADVFDALTHERPYKDAWPVDRARGEIVDLRGAHFDPEVVDAFLELLDSGHL